MRVVVFLALISCFTLAALFPPSFATISYSTCTNATLSTDYNYVWVNVTEANQTTQTMCPFGCNAESGLCNPDPYSSDSTSMFYFLFPLVAFVLLYYAANTKQDDWPIHLLLVGVALILMVIPFGILADAITSAFLYPYVLMWTVFFIIVFYNILKILIRSEKQMRGK